MSKEWPTKHNIYPYPTDHWPNSDDGWVTQAAIGWALTRMCMRQHQIRYMPHPIITSPHSNKRDYFPNLISVSASPEIRARNTAEKETHWYRPSGRPIMWSIRDEHSSLPLFADWLTTRMFLDTPEELRPQRAKNLNFMLPDGVTEEVLHTELQIMMHESPDGHGPTQIS